MTYISNPIDITEVTNGKSGNSYYTWIIYANKKGEEFIDLSNSSEGKEYIGIAYNKIEPEQKPYNSKDYKWSKIQGDKGDKGDNSNSYSIENSTEEILKFFNENNNLEFLPEELKIKVLYSDGEKRIPIIFNKDNKNEKYQVSYNLYLVERTGIQTEIPYDKDYLYHPYIPHYFKDSTSNSEIEYSETGKEGSWEKIFNEKKDLYSRYREGPSSSWITEINEIDSFLKFNVLSFISSQKVQLKEIIKTFKNESATLSFRILKEAELLSVKNFSISFGTSEDMAKFSLNATNISMAMLDSKLIFNKDGLTIKNGNFLIQDNNGEKLLYADNEKKTLVFSGRLSAASGSFKGQVTAETGSLGKVSIAESVSIGNQLFLAAISNNKETKMFDQPRTGIYSKSYYDPTSLVGFKIDLNGDIYAKSIHLGKHAEIEEYIKLGDTYLQNPTKDNGNIFLRSSYIDENNISHNALTIQDKGIIKLGELEENGIILNGRESIIKGKNWRIAPDRAEFANAIISGTLQTTVFEKDSTQISGSSILFKDGEKIISISNQNEKLVIHFNNNGKKKAKDLKNTIINIKIAGTEKAGKIETFVEESGIGKIITDIPYSEMTIDNDSYVVFLGKMNENDTVLSDWLIGINASNSQGMLKLQQNSICFNELRYDADNHTILCEQKILLGKFNNTVGLKAESVDLKGTLTTSYRVKQEGIAYQQYAGVNTISNVGFDPADKMGISDTSNIIFWAGADGTTNAAIQKANFQVTSNGTLYAQQGYFKGTIITDAEIYARKLYATDIFPNENIDSKGLLNLHDTNKGIIFYKDEYLLAKVTAENYQSNKYYYFNENTQKYEKCLDKNFIEGKRYFILNSTSDLSIKNNSFTFNDMETPFIQYKNDKININTDNLTINNSFSMGPISLVQEPLTDEKKNYKLVLNDYSLNSSENGFTFKRNEDILYSYDQANKVDFKTSVQFNNLVHLGKNIEIRQVSSGYDVYIN